MSYFRYQSQIDTDCLLASFKSLLENAGLLVSEEFSTASQLFAEIFEGKTSSSSKVKVLISWADKNQDGIIQYRPGNALEKVKVAEYNYLYSMSQVLPAEKAAELLIAQRYIDGFSAISEKDGDKVFLPNNFQGLFNFWMDSDKGGPKKPGITSD